MAFSQGFTIFLKGSGRHRSLVGERCWEESCRSAECRPNECILPFVLGLVLASAPGATFPFVPFLNGLMSGGTD